MPIIKPTNRTAPVFFPATDYTIVKYLDLTKFISLLQNKALFFCRLDKLEDQFEGMTTKPNRDLRFKIYENYRNSGLSKTEMTDEDIRKKVESQYEFDKNLKAITCVNCWNKKNNESAALWKIYSSFSNGLMIKSSISKLISSLDSTNEEIDLTEIKYLDYSRDYMPEGNSNYPLLHKHDAYSYEEEVRLIYRKMPESGWVYDWTKEEVLEGLYIRCEINKLIDKIVISPFSQNWFFKLIKDISSKYGLDKECFKSELT